MAAHKGHEKLGGKKKGTPSPGSGRTPDWLKHKCQDIVDRSKLLEFLRDVAEGKEIETKTVYDLSGNVVGQEKSAADTKDRIRATEMLLDRGFGKAIQAVEHSGDDGGPIIVKMVNYANS